MEEKNISLREKIVIILFFISALVLCIIGIAKLDFSKKEVPIMEMIQLRNESGGFLYYRGEIYYRHPYLCVPTDLWGEQVGFNEWDIQYSDINSDSRTFEVDENKELCVYAYEEGVSVFKHKNREDVLIVSDSDEFYSSTVYIKDITVDEYEYKCFEDFLQHEPDSTRFVGPALREVPVSFKMSDFEYDSSDLGNPSAFNGYYVFYLLLENDGVYTKVQGTGNQYVDYIVLTSSGEGTTKNYVCHKEGLSEEITKIYGSGVE